MNKIIFFMTLNVNRQFAVKKEKMWADRPHLFNKPNYGQMDAFSDNPYFFSGKRFLTKPFFPV